MTKDIQEVNERFRRESEVIDRVRREISKVIVGQSDLVERLILALLCNGHVLIEGIPGLAKTLSVTTLARTIDASFHRIQFTPDLLPADLIRDSDLQSQDRSVFNTKRAGILQYYSC